MTATDHAHALHWGPTVRTARTAPPNTLAATAYEKIRADIVSGRLKPGTKLQTETIKQQYGIGSSPMREALSHLAADGLVRAEGQKGFRVVPVSIGELADIARLRLTLEIQAVLESLRLATIEWEVGVVAEFHRLQHALDSYAKNPAGYADQWETSHRAFHFALMGGCKSPWLLHFCDRLYDQTERYRRLFTSYEAIPRPLISSHKALMDAAVARDAATVEGLLRRHIVFAARQTLADMKKHGVPADAAAEATLKQLD